MISDRRRREVAAKLRADHRQDHESQVTFIARMVTGKDMVTALDVCRLPKTLADLIDCPTCEMEGHPGARHGRCSRCGAFVRRDAVTDCTGVIPVKFCPNCRAKVI